MNTVAMYTEDRSNNGDNGDLIQDLERLVQKLEEIEQQQMMDRKVIEQALENVKTIRDNQQSALGPEKPLPGFMGVLLKWLKNIRTAAQIVNALTGSLIGVTEDVDCSNKNKHPVWISPGNSAKKCPGKSTSIGIIEVTKGHAQNDTKPELGELLTVITDFVQDFNYNRKRVAEETNT